MCEPHIMLTFKRVGTTFPELCVSLCQLQVLEKHSLKRCQPSAWDVLIHVCVCAVSGVSWRWQRLCYCSRHTIWRPAVHLWLGKRGPSRTVRLLEMWSCLMFAVFCSMFICMVSADTSHWNFPGQFWPRSAQAACSKSEGEDAGPRMSDFVYLFSFSTLLSYLCLVVWNEYLNSIVPLVVPVRY